MNKKIHKLRLHLIKKFSKYKHLAVPLSWKLFSIFVLAIIALFATAQLGNVIHKESIELNELWHTYSETEVRKTKAITKIVRNFGYGGFIHHFKNYILRRDERYYKWSTNSLEQTYAGIEEYLSFDLDKQTRNNIESFRKTVDEYKKKHILAKELVKTGLSIKEIDNIVYVEDRVAKEALQNLFLSTETTNLRVKNLAYQKEISYKQKILYGFCFILLFIIAATIYLVFITIQIAKEYTESSILFQSVPNAIIVANAKGEIIKCNNMAMKLFGYPQEIFAKLTIEDLVPDEYKSIHKKHREKFQESERIVAIGDRNATFSAKKQNGNIFPADISISSYIVGGDRRNIAIIKDLSLESKLKNEASTDYLTQLANRKYGEAFINQSIHNAQRYKTSLSAVLCDIDHFKRINDTYGHNKGDEVLKTIAQLLLKNIRKTDLVFRWGGEEFLIVCPNLSKQGAILLTEKIRHIIKENFAKNTLPITISLGVTEFKTDTDDLTSFIKRADEALYLSKNNGRNQTTAL